MKTGTCTFCTRKAQATCDQCGIPVCRDCSGVFGDNGRYCRADLKRYLADDEERRSQARLASLEHWSLPPLNVGPHRLELDMLRWGAIESDGVEGLLRDRDAAAEWRASQASKSQNELCPACGGLWDVVTGKCGCT